jgi:NADH-quinone oxidoreductase subunit C
VSTFEKLKEIVSAAELVAPTTARDGHESVRVPAEDWLRAAQWLQEHGFHRFIDLTCADHPERAARYEVHLVVYSMEERRWFRLLTETDDELASVYALYQGVHNYEREVFDLFGVTFTGHPKLTRILLPDGWEGHPLQRDMPLSIEPTDFTITRELYNT